MIRQTLRKQSFHAILASILLITFLSVSESVVSSQNTPVDRLSPFEFRGIPAPRKGVPNMVAGPASGNLDAILGSGGNLTANSGSHGSATEIAVQTDGKIVAVGYANVGDNFDNDFAVFRYNADGSLDTSFDGDGKVITSFSNQSDAALAVAIQADGKIVAAGVTTDEKGSWFAALARYNTDGSLDTSFGSGGKVISDGADIGSIVVQPDGKILADGGGSWVIRYNPDGSLDNSFGTAGFTTAGFGVWAVAVQPDGKVVAAGDNYCDDGDCNRDFALARFNPDGSLDTSFDSDGILTTRFAGASSVASSLILQSDGKIVAAGYDAEKLAVARYNADGSLDASFDGDGKILRPVGLATWHTENSAALQADGKIIVCGSTSDDEQNFDFALVRLNTDGSLDTSFDADGKLTTDFGGGEDYAFDVALQPNGKIIAAGFATMATRDFALSRYNPDGSLDASFDGDGKVTTSFQNRPTLFDYDGDRKTDFSVYRPSNGTWYVARSLTSDMYVRTFWSDGIYPADYDGDGKTDLATCDYSSGQSVPLIILNSLTNTISSQQCLSGDLGLAADFDGDGKADFAAWEGGSWQITMSQSGSTYTQQWGVAGDKPVPADFDGDGRAELAVWRPSEGKWYVANIATGSISTVTWGVDGDIPVVGDYNGDGRADYAVYRPSNNSWYRLHSNDYTIAVQTWGATDDIVTPGDYDGDGRMDAAVFRPSEGKWYVLTAANGIVSSSFGQSGDIPTPGAFIY